MVSGRLWILYLADNQDGKVLGEAAWRPGSGGIVTREPAAEHPRSGICYCTELAGLSIKPRFLKPKNTRV